MSGSYMQFSGCRSRSLCTSCFKSDVREQASAALLPCKACKASVHILMFLSLTFFTALVDTVSGNQLALWISIGALIWPLWRHLCHKHKSVLPSEVAKGSKQILGFGGMLQEITWKSLHHATMHCSPAFCC